jgi:ABC-type multidrug transport system ATPase subunit
MINENLLQDEEKDKNMNIYIKNEFEKLKSKDELTVKISNLSKTFFYCCKKNVKAINHLYLSLESNEKFGLLGFNGSGKTTTFRAITNEIIFENGSISLFGFDNKKQINKIKPMIGYCPQEDPLFDYMKVREIIEFYKKLKRSSETVESICSKFDLTKYLDTYCMNLSGGNKRKLSFTIALINKPNILLLDEPSTGVDPESRRVMWRNINELSNSGHKYNMILTTHSIEEAEILCDTVSWLKAGNFICVGNPEELKIEFSRGYKLHLKFDDAEINKMKNDEKIEDILSNLKELAFGVDAFESEILENKNVVIENYLVNLIEILNQIKDKTKKIEINDIRKDMSFELGIEIIKERQKDLFVQVLNLKNVNIKISELSITMQSLENILTSLN